MLKRRFYKPKRNLNRVKRPQSRVQRPHPEREQMQPVDINVVKKILTTVFFIAVIAWFIYFFLISDNFFIKTVHITGSKNIPTEELQSIVNDNLQKKQYILFPNKNILLFAKEDLIKDISDKYIVENIIIDKNPPFELRITLEEKLARLILKTKTLVAIPTEADEPESKEEGTLNEKKSAQEDEEVEQGSEEDEEEATEPEPVYTIDYFYLDVNGIIVSLGNISEHDRSTLPTIEMEFDNQTLVKPGDIIMDRERVEYIFSVYETVGKSKAGLELDYIFYNPEIEDEITITTKEGWQAFLSTQIALETQIKKLELALDEKIRENRANLQYVDLRVKDRVYFK